MTSKTLLLAFLILLFAIILRFFTFFTNQTYYAPGTFLTFETTLVSNPKISNKGQSVSIVLPNNDRAAATLAIFPELSYGDHVKISGKVTFFTSTNGSKIAYLRYPKFEIIKRGSDSSLLIKFRQDILNFFEANLPQTDSSLMLGIVFGIKEDFPASFALNIKNTGLLHVIAASGMNITMVGGFLSALFSYFFRRQVALALSIFGILFYALLAGFEPSIVRAAIMGILVFSAQIFGRQTLSFIGLFLAAFIMLFINPALLSDVGFELSFMATFGLIFFRPLFYKSSKVKAITEKTIVGEDVLTTVTAQIFTLPILLVNFGSYSIWSVLVNGLVLWTVPPLMVIGGIAAIIGIVLAPLGHLILILSLPLLFYFEAVVNFFGSIGGLISIQSLPLAIVLGYYLLLFAVILRFRK